MDLFTFIVYSEAPASYAVVVKIIEIAQDISHLPIAILFEMLWFRMRFLHKYLRAQLTEDKNVEEKSICLRKFLYMYRSLLDNVENVFRPLAALTLLEVVYSYIKILSDVHFAIVVIINEKSVRNLTLTVFLGSVLDFSVLSVGAIFLEKTLNEYGGMKSTISAELMVLKDKQYREQIYTCLNYLEVRPPSYTIWHILPMNFRMMVILLDLIVTYVIVLISFKI
ncbi:unnamed protein product [Leptosia nina]|uniref:Gustatory receptor n=1 Tax=Leptosia nina TaxID=320188 RepID=A0AAV1J8B6_9NEOP